MTATTTQPTWTDADLTPKKSIDRIMEQVLTTLQKACIHGAKVVIRPTAWNRWSLFCVETAYLIKITFDGEERFLKHRRTYRALSGTKISSTRTHALNTTTPRFSFTASQSQKATTKEPSNTWLPFYSSEIPE